MSFRSRIHAVRDKVNAAVPIGPVGVAAILAMLGAGATVAILASSSSRRYGVTGRETWRMPSGRGTYR